MSASQSQPLGRGESTATSGAEPSAARRTFCFLPVSQDAAAIGDLFRLDRAGWSGDSYVISHGGANIHLWISNGHCYLRWWVGDRNAWDGKPMPRWRDRLYVWRAMNTSGSVYAGDVAGRAREALAKALGADPKAGA